MFNRFSVDAVQSKECVRIRSRIRETSYEAIEVIQAGDVGCLNQVDGSGNDKCLYLGIFEVRTKEPAHIQFLQGMRKRKELEIILMFLV